MTLPYIQQKDCVAIGIAFFVWINSTGRNLNERTFRPDYRVKPLTDKFYARHDCVQIENQNLKNYQYFANEIEKFQNYDRRDHNFAPITENQRYGWLERLAEKYSGLDAEILNHKRPQDEMMRVMKKIAVDLERDKFIKRM
ncbi:uncharacterized protein ACRADG_012833 [Cochliomyia hominivorax]